MIHFPVSLQNTMTFALFHIAFTDAIHDLIKYNTSSLLLCFRLREKNLSWVDIFEEIPVSMDTVVWCNLIQCLEDLGFSLSFISYFSK